MPSSPSIQGDYIVHSKCDFKVCGWSIFNIDRLPTQEDLDLPRYLDLEYGNVRLAPLLSFLLWLVSFDPLTCDGERRVSQKGSGSPSRLYLKCNIRRLSAAEARTSRDSAVSHVVHTVAVAPIFARKPLPASIMGDDTHQIQGQEYRDVYQDTGKSKASSGGECDLRYVQYDVQQEHIFLDPIRQLISKDLSGKLYQPLDCALLPTDSIATEPYSIYVLPILSEPMGRPMLHGTLMQQRQ